MDQALSDLQDAVYRLESQCTSSSGPLLLSVSQLVAATNAFANAATSSNAQLVSLLRKILTDDLTILTKINNSTPPGATSSRNKLPLYVVELLPQLGPFTL